MGGCGSELYSGLMVLVEKRGRLCMVRRWSGSRKVHEWVPGRAIRSKGPKNFSDSFLAGRVVRMCSALTKTC